MHLILVSIPFAIIAGLVTWLLVSPVCRLARLLGALDRPGGRKWQPHPIPLLGGIAIVGGFLGSLYLALSSGLGEEALGALPGSPSSFLLAFGWIFLIGLLDDLRDLSPLVKLVAQVLAAALLVAEGCSFQIVNLPFFGVVELGAWGAFVSLLWIVGVTNAINLIDGLDGLAGGIVAIASISLLLFTFSQNNLGSMLLLSMIAGACLGFLYHNWSPARIFMGDSGSLTLGFLLATMSVSSSIKAPAAAAILVPILALGLPIIDTVLVMAARFLEATEASFPERLTRVVKADRNHLHHALLRLAPGRLKVIWVLYALAVSFCLMALVAALTKDPNLGFVFLLVQFLVIAAIRKADIRRRTQEIAQESRARLKDEILSEEGARGTTPPPPPYRPARAADPPPCRNGFS